MAIDVNDLNAIVFQPYCGTDTPEHFFASLPEAQKPVSMKGVMYVQSIENIYRIYFYLEDHWLLAESDADLMELVNSLKKPTDGQVYPNGNIWDVINTIISNNNDNARMLRDLLANGGGGYILPTATSEILGGVKIGEGLNIEDGVLSVSGSNVAMEQFTSDSAGIVPAAGASSSKLLFSDGSWHELLSQTTLGTTAVAISLSKDLNPFLALNISQASTTQAGVMSAEDKQKLDSLTSIEGVEI